MLMQPILPYVFLLKPEPIPRRCKPREIELSGWMPSEAINLPWLHFERLLKGTDDLRLEICGPRSSRRVMFFQDVQVTGRDSLASRVYILRDQFIQHLRHDLLVV